MKMPVGGGTHNCLVDMASEFGDVRIWRWIPGVGGLNLSVVTYMMQVLDKFNSMTKTGFLARSNKEHLLATISEQSKLFQVSCGILDS